MCVCVCESVCGGGGGWEDKAGGTVHPSPTSNPLPCINYFYLGILNRALIGFSPNSGGVLSPISIAVIPSDHTSARES